MGMLLLQVLLMAELFVLVVNFSLNGFESIADKDRSVQGLIGSLPESGKFEHG